MKIADAQSDACNPLLFQMAQQQRDLFIRDPEHAAPMSRQNDATSADSGREAHVDGHTCGTPEQIFELRRPRILAAYEYGDVDVTIEALEDTPRVRRERVGTLGAEVDTQRMPVRQHQDQSRATDEAERADHGRRQEPGSL